jgi:hypothetical protein
VCVCALLLFPSPFSCLHCVRLEMGAVLFLQANAEAVAGGMGSPMAAIVPRSEERTFGLNRMK